MFKKYLRLIEGFSDQGFFNEIDYEVNAGRGIFRICQLIVNYVLNPKNQMIDTLNF